MCGQTGGNQGAMPAGVRCLHGGGSLPPASCEWRHRRKGGGSRGVPPPAPPTATPAAAAEKSAIHGEQKGCGGGGRREGEGWDGDRREVPRFARGRPGPARPHHRGARRLCPRCQRRSGTAARPDRSRGHTPRQTTPRAAHNAAAPPRPRALIGSAPFPHDVTGGAGRGARFKGRRGARPPQRRVRERGAQAVKAAGEAGRHLRTPTPCVR